MSDPMLMRVRLAAVLLAAVTFGVAGTASAADAMPSDAPAYNDGDIHPYHVQGQVWLMAGEPGASNVAVQIGDEGVLVVDTGATAAAQKLLDKINQIAAEHAGDQKAIRLVLNTNGLPDHIGGNDIVRKGGSTIVAGNFAFDNLGLEKGASVMANQNVLMRLVAENAAGKSSAAQPLWPSDTVDNDVYDMAFNGEAVQLLHPHAASTDGEEMVMFRHSDVLVTGDTVSMLSYPLIDVARGGTIDGELVALNKIIEMAVPLYKAEGGTLIIPGHGRVCDQSDIVNYKNILTTIRNRIQYYKNGGKTLAQVQALAPSSDFDGRWGASSGPWTTTQFVQAVYTTLPAKGPSFSMQTTTLVPATATVTAGKSY